MKHQQFWKILSIFIEKYRWRKVRSVITPTFSTDFDSDNAVMLCSMSSFLMQKFRRIF